MISESWYKAGSGPKMKKGAGGRRNPSQKLDSAKEIQGFPLIVFGRAWLNLAGFGENGNWLGKTKSALASLGDRLRPAAAQRDGLAISSAHAIERHAHYFVKGETP
jgi:hypothetical protein